MNRDRFIANETNRRTNSNFIGITTLHVLGSLSAHHQEFLAYIGIGTFYAVVITGSSLLLVANGHQIRIKCTNADVWLRTPDDGRKDCSKHVEL